MRQRNQILIGVLVLVSIAVGCGRAETPESASPSIPGWEKFETDTVELWLPQRFEGLDLSDEKLDVLVEKMRALGPDFEKMAQVVKQNRTAFVMWAFDTEESDSGVLTNVNVTTGHMQAAMPMNHYLDMLAAQLPRQYRVVEQEIVSLDGHQAGRLVLEFESPEAVLKQMLYVIMSDNTVWTVNYATGTEEFDERLPVFERSIRSFRVRPQPLWRRFLNVVWAKLAGR